VLVAAIQVGGGAKLGEPRAGGAQLGNRIGAPADAAQEAPIGVVQQRTLERQPELLGISQALIKRRLGGLHPPTGRLEPAP
jgi:hypothetical protein